jgi:hypothetical protein
MMDLGPVIEVPETHSLEMMGMISHFKQTGADLQIVLDHLSILVSVRMESCQSSLKKGFLSQAND